jgi:hypothetical protein
VVFVLKKNNNQGRRFFVSSVFFLFFSALNLSNSMAGDLRSDAGIEESNSHSGSPILALHAGEKHDLIPENRESMGACPQERKTQRAPGEYYFQENPLEPTEKISWPGKHCLK